MPRYPYRDLGTNLDREFRNNLNANFSDIESDMREAHDRIEDIDARIDNIVAQAGNDNTEIVDARNDSVNNVTYPTLKDRLDNQSAETESLKLQSNQNANDVKERGINILFPPAPLVGAKGDYDPETGSGTDDTAAIQAIIDYANAQGIRKVFVPSGRYLISDSIVLNGCTMEGVATNIYDASNRGAVFYAKTKDFIAIRQGSVQTSDIQFSIKNILVRNAYIGFEIVYAINSRFERLYAQNCEIGFKLGDLSSVGSMFCEFNHLWTSGCQKGVEVRSSNFFNNNTFNNGFIQGEEYAFYLEVQGGYGAVNNVFNNVEFRSAQGRGIIMNSALNTVFNHPYFECGGNAIRTLNFCSFVLNESVFGLFKQSNTNGDTSTIYSENGMVAKINGGTIFLNAEYENHTFYKTAVPATHANITVINEPRKEDTATGFKMFDEAYSRDVRYLARRVEEQVVNTPTLTVPAGGYTDFTWTYSVPFSRTPEVVIPVMRGEGYQANTTHWILSEKTQQGGKIRVYNTSSSTDRQVYFTVYAKTLAQ